MCIAVDDMGLIQADISACYQMHGLLWVLGGGHEILIPWSRVPIPSEWVLADDNALFEASTPYSRETFRPLAVTDIFVLPRYERNALKLTIWYLQIFHKGHVFPRTSTFIGHVLHFTLLS